MSRWLGRYELLEQVGSGGMAVVYRGRDSALDREVAVKLLHPHLAEAPESRARFAREARAVARLAHPGIVEIYDFAGDTAPESYLVTEFVRGRTLRTWAQQVGVGFPEIGLLLGRALSDALVHAHSAGVIHRDLKPENVLIQETGRPAVKLADFGIARILASDERMTMTGALVGSPHHMAPEIVEGREADARSDLFSLGTLLYWLVTGKLPFAASNPTAILRRALEGDFEDPRAVDPRVSDGLAALLCRCLSVDPAGRPQSAAELREGLDALLAEVGLARPEEELLAFLGDPAAYKAAYPARAVTALLARGDAALAEGTSARALAAFDRVLALDPSNAAVTTRLQALSRRRRVRRLVALAAASALTAGVAVAAVKLWPAPAPPSDGPTTPAEPATASPGEPPGSAAPGPATTGVPAGRGPRQGPPGHTPSTPTASAGAQAARLAAGPAAGPAAPPTELVVHVRPYAQRALLDGVEVPAGQPVIRFAIPAEGSHLVQIEHACCVPFQRHLTADEAATLADLRVSLEPRPARLRVEGEPSTRILVDGHAVGTAGESQRAPLAVPIPATGENPYESQVQLVLEPTAGAPRTFQVKLRAGAELVVAAPAAEVPP